MLSWALSRFQSEDGACPEYLTAECSYYREFLNQTGLKDAKQIMFNSIEFCLGSLMKTPLLSHVCRPLMSPYQPSLTRLLCVLWNFTKWLLLTYPLLLPNSITFLTSGIFPGSIMDLFLQIQKGKNRKTVISGPTPIFLGWIWVKMRSFGTWNQSHLVTFH